MSRKIYTFSPPVESVDELEAKIKPGAIVYDRIDRTSRGEPCQWRVNGQMKRWKRDRTRMELPLKHGLYCYFRVTDLEEFNLYFALSYE